MINEDQLLPKPTWAILARPVGAQHESWDEKCVSARSAIQAEAILRRKGYEVKIESAKMTCSDPDDIGQADLKPIQCSRCGYQLSGLVIDSASVLCPECNFKQLIVPWSKEYANSQSESAHSVFWFFASIGFIVSTIIVLIVVASIF
jgi:DNA-directed RNA polymerase subunit RPC12/RpoP